MTTAAGGTHPTGMHSCFRINVFVLQIPMSKAFPFSGILEYVPHPISCMHLVTAVELAAGLCLLLGKSPKTKQRGCFMMIPMALLELHAFFPDDVSQGIHLYSSNGSRDKGVCRLK